MSKKLLIIGQLPPPVHGSNIMTELFCNSLKKIGHEVSIIQKTFSKQQKDIGKFSAMKVLKFPLIAAKLIYHLIKISQICVSILFRLNRLHSLPMLFYFY